MRKVCAYGYVCVCVHGWCVRVKGCLHVEVALCVSR